MKIQKKILTLCSTLFFAQTTIYAVSAQNKAITPYTPTSILADGKDSNISINPYTGLKGDVRKGTIAATINNAQLLNKLIDQNAKQQELEPIIVEVKKLIPSLHIVGLFNFFSPEEWLSTNEQMGRVLIAILYLQQYPDQLNAHSKELIKTFVANKFLNINLKNEILKLDFKN